MALIFLGDIASPDEKCSADLHKSLSEVSYIFSGNHTILNLEGMVCDTDMATDTPILFNHPSIIPVLQEIDCSAVSLANNHALDLPDHSENTRKILNEKNVETCGVGTNAVEAAAPARFKADGCEIVVFGFCWEILNQHHRDIPGVCYVNPLKAKGMLKSVSQERERNPESIIVLKVHWSFDLETLPFPLYRQLAMDLIEAGANAVIGCHSHCVQGGERHKKGIIVYGLGNFFIPWHTFINGTIHFPEFSRKEIALEWDPATGKATCHWFHYHNVNKIHRLEYQGSEDFDSGPRIREHSKYASMDRVTYLKWFRENRRKSKLMPIYKDYRHQIRNLAIDIYLKGRIRVARYLARTGLREWNN